MNEHCCICGKPLDKYSTDELCTVCLEEALDADSQEEHDISKMDNSDEEE